MSTRRSGRSRSQSRSRRDEEEAGSEPAPAPSPARLAGSESESEFEESQEADERVLERAEELEKIKEQQRETREGLAALRQRFEDQGAAAAESAAEVKGLLQQLLAGSGTSAGSAAGNVTHVTACATRSLRYDPNEIRLYLDGAVSRSSVRWAGVRWCVKRHVVSRSSPAASRCIS